MNQLMNQPLNQPTSVPTLQWLYTADVDIGERRDLGATQGGHRYMIDILGGHFAGPLLRGTVLPGGADRQWQRPDGAKELDALYEMQTDDGAVLTVHNRVCIEDNAPCAPGGPVGRYARSVVKITAPDGPYAWLSRRILVGTLDSLRPERAAVRITVYLVV
jgi:Protein of unknown function (DUF3237)